MIKMLILLAPLLWAQMVTEFRSEKYPDKPVTRLGKLVFLEDFNNLDGWFSEGNIRASNPDGLLKIETSSAFTNPNAKDKSYDDRGNVWSKREFEAPLYFEWKFKDLTDGLNLIFWSARTVDGSDFFGYKRDWDMKWLIFGNLECYHISYSRGGTAFSNFRKNPGFHQLVKSLTVPDPLPDIDGRWHRVGVYQKGSHIMFFVDGKRIHDVDENIDFAGKFICHNPKKHWKYETCPGLHTKKHYLKKGERVDFFGRPYVYKVDNKTRALTYTSGRIGFRHQNGTSLYDSLRVWKID